MKTVIDAYAWIEIFIGSKNGEKAKEILEKAEETYTPDVVMAEIARKYMREEMKEHAILERLTTIEETSEIVSIDKNIALESAKCYLELTEKAIEERLQTPVCSFCNKYFVPVRLSICKNLFLIIVTEYLQVRTE